MKKFFEKMKKFFIGLGVGFFTALAFAIFIILKFFVLKTIKKKKYNNNSINEMEEDLKDGKANFVSDGDLVDDFNEWLDKFKGRK